MKYLLIAIFALLPCFIHGSSFSLCPDGKQQCATGKCCERVIRSQKTFYCCEDESCNSVNCKIISDLPRPHLILKAKLPSVSKRFFCPDRKTICRDNQTCCELLSGRYSCCQYPRAVCCSNRRYCCPEFSVCHNNMCYSVNSHAWQGAQRLEASPLEQLGSCYYQDGELCPSNQHCCPKSHVCSSDSSKCIAKSGDKSSIFNILKPMELSPDNSESKVLKNPLESVICPDGSSQCPDGSTCCLMDGGAYGCCPYENAVCCSDHEHCCPEGTTCDLEKSTCIRSDAEVPLKVKTKAVKVSNTPGNSVICPGGSQQCDNGFTCCKLPAGGYGCCPIPNAVCCSDHIHCCPSGFSCSHNTCEKAKEPMKLIFKN